MRASRSGGGRPRSAGRDPAVDLGARKEKVLHTRVPQSLDRQLKEKAQNLGLSVSTVVRHVLLNTFGLVEDIVVDSANLAFSIAGNDAASKSDARGPTMRGASGTTDVVGWQEAVLNVNGVCDRCNTLLRKARKAAIAIRERPGPRTLLCMACLDALAAATDERVPARKRKSASDEPVRISRKTRRRRGAR